jgi:hypothetical protein
VADRRIVEKLKEVIERLEDRHNSRGLVMIRVPEALDRDKVVGRHYQLYPLDKGAANIIFITGGDPSPPFADTERKENAAWQSVAEEEMAGRSKASVRIEWGQRAIQRAIQKSRQLDAHPPEIFTAGVVGWLVAQYGVAEAFVKRELAVIGLDIVGNDRVAWHYAQGKKLNAKVHAGQTAFPIKNRDQEERLAHG